MPNWQASDLTLVQIAAIDELALKFDQAGLAWLSEDELSRYRAISSEHRKRQFLGGHFLVREMASRAYANPLADWTYLLDDGNQRRLRPMQSQFPELYVSISHSGKWIAAAISQMPVGIDIEHFGKQRDFMAIANHVFSGAEVALLKTCSPEQLVRRFYLHWTLKECLAKQFGDGLRFETTRANSPHPVSESEDASMQSWECGDYVTSLASGSASCIETIGLCESVQHRRWRDMPNPC